MRPTTVYCYSPSLLSVPSVDRASPSLWCVWSAVYGDLHTHMHFSSCHTVRAREATFTLTESNTMVKPLEKSTKFWDGHELLRLVEL